MGMFQAARKPRMAMAKPIREKILPMMRKAQPIPGGGGGEPMLPGETIIIAPSTT